MQCARGRKTEHLRHKNGERGVVVVLGRYAFEQAALHAFDPLIRVLRGLEVHLHFGLENVLPEAVRAQQKGIARACIEGFAHIRLGLAALPERPQYPVSLGVFADVFLPDFSRFYECLWNTVVVRLIEDLSVTERIKP